MNLALPTIFYPGHTASQTALYSAETTMKLTTPLNNIPGEDVLVVGPSVN